MTKDEKESEKKLSEWERRARDIEKRIKEIVKCANCQSRFKWGDAYVYDIGTPYLGARVYCPNCGFRLADSPDSEHWQWYGPNTQLNEGKLFPPGSRESEYRDGKYVLQVRLWGNRVPYHAWPSLDDTFLNLAQLKRKYKIWEPTVSVNGTRAERINRTLPLAGRPVIEVIVSFKEITQEVKDKIKEALKTLPVLPKESLQVKFEDCKRAWRFSPDRMPFEGNLDTVCDHLFSRLKKDFLKPDYESSRAQVERWQAHDYDTECLIPGSYEVIKQFDNRFMTMDVFYEKIARPYLIGRADVDWYCLLEP